MSSILFRLKTDSARLAKWGPGWPRVAGKCEGTKGEFPLALAVPWFSEGQKSSWPSGCLLSAVSLFSLSLSLSLPLSLGRKGRKGGREGREGVRELAGGWWFGGGKIHF